MFKKNPSELWFLSFLVSIYFAGYSYQSFPQRTPSLAWTTPDRSQRGWKDSRSFWNSKNQPQRSINIWTLTHCYKHNETSESQFPQKPGHNTAAFTSTSNVQQSNLFPALILQDPPEPSAVVRQLPASVPAVKAQRVQDAGLCCWKDPLLCGPGSSGLWPEAIPLWRWSAEGPQHVLWLWLRQVCHTLESFLHF